MLALDLLPQIVSYDFPPIILICPGKAPFNKEAYEPMLAEQVAEALVKRFVPPDMADLCYTTYYADEAKAGDITLEAQTLPFLAEQRVILIRNAGKYAQMSGEKGSAIEPILHYLSEPNPSTLLILVADKIDKRKKFYKTFEKYGLVVTCPQLEDNQLQHWVKAEAQRQNKQIQANAIGELLHRAGGRLSDVANNLNLVITYIGEEATITEQHVITACADVAEETVWALTDAIAASDSQKAVATLHQLLELGKAPDELMGIINWLLESAYKASPETKAQLQSNFVARKVLPLAQKFGLPRLKRAFALCTETHFMIRSTGVDKLLALELLIVKLSAGGGAKNKRRSA